MIYRQVLASEVLHFFMARRTSDRQFLIKSFDELAADPYKAGDLQQTDADGRVIEVAIRGRFLIGYWADHAVKEIRLVGVAFTGTS